MTTSIYPWINFILFLGLLVYFLRSPLKDFLGDRRESLRRELEELAQKRAQLERRFEEYRKRLGQTEQEIRRLKEELSREGELERQALIKKAQDFAQKIREDAKKMGAQELTKAKLALKRKIVLLTLELASFKLKKSIQPKDQERLAIHAVQHLEGLKYERTNPR